jgi:Stress responsive A/B Barrel Domain
MRVYPSTMLQWKASSNSACFIKDGITHVFVSEFENEEDRKYYLEQDPAHLSFVKSIGNIVARAHVVDFVPGEFKHAI